MSESASPLELMLVRHGESASNRERVFGGHGPAPLTDLGRRQAEAAAAAIARLPVDAIYASDLVRTVETAAPLARRTGLSPLLTEALRERSVGRLTGMTFAEVQERLPDEWAALLSYDVDHRPPDGESHRDCALRVGRFVDELVAARPSGGRVVLVSHGVAIHHLVCHLFGLGGAPTRFVIHVDNCSIHRLQLRGDGRWRVVALNDVAHLAEIEPPATS